MRGTRIMEEDIEDLLQDDLDSKQNNPEPTLPTTKETQVSNEPLVSQKVVPQLITPQSIELDPLASQKVAPQLITPQSIELDPLASQKVAPQLITPQSIELDPLASQKVVPQPTAPQSHMVKLEVDEVAEDCCISPKRRRLQSDEAIADSTIILATSQKHLKIRQEADARYKLNAERMKLKCSKGKRKKVQI